VGGRDAHPYGQFADLEMAGAVDADGGQQRKFGARFRQHLRPLALGEAGKRLVFEGGHRPAVVLVAHAALKGHQRPGARVAKLARQRGGVERGGGKAKHGGKDEL